MREAGQHATVGAHGDPARDLVHVVQDVVVLAVEERRAPELVLALADEVVVEHEAGDDRAERQNSQRDQHDRRASCAWS